LLQKHGEAVITWLLFIIVIGIYGTKLSPYVQSADEAEMLVTAVQGGVLHPPGYPLQGMLNKLFVSFFGATAWSLSLLSFVMFLLMGWCLHQITAILEWKKWVRFLVLALFLFNPHLLYFATQTSKYMTTVSLQFLVIFSLLSFYQGKNIFGYLASLIFGIGLAHHPVSLLLSPLLVVVYLHRKAKSHQIIISAALLLTGFIATYLTIFFQTAPGLYPDWGKVASLSELIDLMTRKDLSSFNDKMYFSLFAGRPLNGLVNNMQLWISELNIFWFAWLAGLFWIIKKRQLLTGAIAVTMMLLMGILLAHNDQVELHWMTRNIRWGTMVVPYLILIIGVGLQLIPCKKKFALIGAPIVILFFANYTLLQFDRVDTTKMNYLDLFSEAIGQELADEDYYLGDSDEQIFYGAVKEGKRRYSVMSLNTYWYRRQAMKYVEPRIVEKKYMYETLLDLMKKLYLDNNVISTVNGQLVVNLGGEWIKRGVLFKTGKGLTKNPEERYQSAKRLCEVILKIHKAPVMNGQYYSQQVLLYFKQSFMIDAAYLMKNGLGPQSLIMNELAKNLNPEADVSKWHQLCKQL
jgi:hypothetical protein